MALEEVEQLRSRASSLAESEKKADELATRFEKQEEEHEQEQEQEQGRHALRKEDETKNVKRDRWALAKRLWAKTNLDPMTMKVMAKGALAPTIALAAYQSTGFADVFTTLGYLVGVITILSFAVMPRAKFVQTFCASVLTTCVAAAVALLAIYCCVQARIHTTAVNHVGTGGSGTSGTPVTGASTAPYNSSSAAVAGVWLFFEIYIINAIRARNMQLIAPGIIACIFANISMVYAPQFSTMTQGINFARKLLVTFLTGLAIGGGVSLFVFPVTVRSIVCMQMTGYVMTIRKLLAANVTYLHSLEEADMFSRQKTKSGVHPARSPEVQAIKGILAGLTALHGKLGVDLTFAKREIAIGKLGPDDFQGIFRHLRSLLLPIIGLSSVADIFERIAHERGWDQPLMDSERAEGSSSDEELRTQSIEEWHAIMKMVRGPFSKIVDDIDEGLRHVLITLELISPPNKQTSTANDVEAKGDQPRPGEKGFAAYFQKRKSDFHNNKQDLLKQWCTLHGIDLSQDFFEKPKTADFTAPAWYGQKLPSDAKQRYRRQLYLVLYIDFLLDAIGQSVYEFVLFADDRLESGKLSRKRLIVPGLKRTRKWIMTAFSRQEDAYTDEQNGMNEDGGRNSNVYLGDAFHKRKDPEHLAPTTSWEKIGDRFRGISHFLRSPESMFGFRVACATMCLAVVAFLHDTQRFYVVQRLFWSQIMVTISMTPSSGQSVFSFGLRILGTFSAMCSSFIVYYIVDGHPAGVLVFFWFVCAWGFYIVLKFPKIIPVGMIFSVTNTLIIGYELQVKKIGVEIAESNGQAYYPIYELAPYRLAAVCAGLFVAYIWTVFPYPISEHSALRKDLGSSLYLLANYYSVVHETVRVRIRGCETNLMDERSPSARLEKARLKVFAKSMLLLQGLRMHSAFVKFDVPIGGKFPAATYDKIISKIQEIMNYTSLMSYASRTFSDMNDEEARVVNGNGSESQWLSDFRRLIQESKMTSREITSLLALLSASVASGQPLPPYLQPPEPYPLSSRLETMDRDILGVRHMAEPGFAAFAVMQICTKSVIEDISVLLSDIKELVGELDFSFHTVKTNDGTADESNDRLASLGDSDGSKSD